MKATPTIMMLALPLAACVSIQAQEKSTPPEEKAIAYLAREVPRWSRENRCYSCHNNGDGARALYLAKKLGFAVADEALADTTRWLSQPKQWERNGGDGPFSDKQLAKLQFATTLVEATGAAQKYPEAVQEALAMVVAAQQPDGSWSVDTGKALGGPTTHGQSVATALVRRALKAADAEKYREPLKRADEWLHKAPVNNVMDAAAILLTADQRPREDCLNLIRKGQAEDGGWGPYVNAPPEVFDTALVVLGLTNHRQEKGVPEMLRKGRAYLIAQQRPDGGWAETTRPAGGDSYAQRISTAGWAAWALLATRRQ